MQVVTLLIQPCLSGWRKLTSFPKLYSIPLLLILLLIGVYVLKFVIAKPITLTYSGNNCVKQLTFLPDKHRALDSSPFTISFDQHIKVFDAELVALQSCISLDELADVGSYTVRLSPFGTWLAASNYEISVPEPPTVSAAALTNPIPLTKPVVLGLSTQDETFAYTLQANDKEVSCNVVSAEIHCELKNLSLEQGKTYDFAVVRYFNQRSVETIAASQAEILHPTTVVNSTIKQDELVYSRPTEISISFDKDLKSAKAKLLNITGDASEEVQTEQHLGQRDLGITFAELPRQTAFKLTIDTLESQDGSSLQEPYELKFSMSGGPKVASVSIPKSGVALGATAELTFDQPLLPDQDLASMLTIVGAEGLISQLGETIMVSLRGVDKCTDFTLKLNNNVQSNYGIGGSSTWSYSSRTVCHSTQIIGYSVRGRPIVAHIFGSGSTNILYIGATHGNELSSAALMRAWINELEANAGSLPAGRRIVVIPEVNPDGVLARTRNNANNVDLNRNYEMSNWRADVTDTRGNLIKNGGGTAPMSEPEVRALAAYTAALRPRITLSYHSQGNMVMGNGAGDSATLSQAYSRLSGYRDVTGNVSGSFSYQITGTHEDWMAEKLGLPNLVIELSSSTNAEFSRNKAGLWDMAGR